MPFLPLAHESIVSRDKPPLTSCPPGYRWQYFAGCNCGDVCQFNPHCLGRETPHWRQVIVSFDLPKMYT